jgi:hypothetical protein
LVITFGRLSDHQKRIEELELFIRDVRVNNAGNNRPDGNTHTPKGPTTNTPFLDISPKHFQELAAPTPVDVEQ